MTRCGASNDPTYSAFDLVQCGEEGLEGCRLGEGGLVGEELQPSGLVGGVQPFEEQATEEAREHLHGEEEAGPAGNPGVAIGRYAAAGDDDMGVRMGRVASRSRVQPASGMWAAAPVRVATDVYRGRGHRGRAAPARPGVLNP